MTALHLDLESRQNSDAIPRVAAEFHSIQGAVIDL
jgi:hypothetical protein